MEFLYLFSPPLSVLFPFYIAFQINNFVYRGLEKRTCHWGFDPENWRNYLLVPKEQGNSEKCENEKLLEAMKAKFDVSNMSKNNNMNSPLKRRQQVSSKEDQCLCLLVMDDSPSKVGSCLKQGSFFDVLKPTSYY